MQMLMGSPFVRYVQLKGEGGWYATKGVGTESGERGVGGEGGGTVQ